MGLELEGLTGEINAAAFAVHNELGPGFLEKIYEEAMVLELEGRGLRVDRQRRVPVRFRGVVVGEHVLDLVVEDKVVVELKSADALLPVHVATLLSYLRATDLRIGLLMNFRAARIELKQILNSWAPPCR